MKSVPAAAIALGLIAGAQGASANAFDNPGFKVVGALGPVVTTVGLDGGPSAPDGYAQGTVTPSTLTTSLQPSTNTLLSPELRGRLLVLSTDGGVGGGNTGNGVGTILNQVLPAGSARTIDIRVVSGTVWRGFVNQSSAFDSGGTGFIAGTGD